MRVAHHPILTHQANRKEVTIFVDGKELKAYKGEPILAALLANDIKVTRYTTKQNRPRGLFCGIGRCTDCVMTVNREPNIRTCITPVEDGMRIQTQIGKGKWSDEDG
jgi:predicted molibdopterin-dependent oxidoreductase YjgC